VTNDTGQTKEFRPLFLLRPSDDYAIGHTLSATAFFMSKLCVDI